MTDILKATAWAGSGGVFPTAPTLQLFPTTDFTTNGLDMRLDLNNVHVTCQATAY